LAEKFDIAGLVYSITTLEKLRWSLKNSDAARPLLEATIIRLAMSEHFINVDQLLSQSPPSQDKKKVTSNPNPVNATPRQQQLLIETTSGTPQVGDIESIKSNWQGILTTIGDRLGPGTAGLLGCAQPIRFENGTLMLEFDASAAVQKKMCEGNGRVEQIEAVLREQWGRDVRVELRIAEGGTKATDEPALPRTRSQRQNEIINDPAVKTVIMGLDATITNIDDG
jgi:hypothetical protein